MGLLGRRRHWRSHAWRSRRHVIKAEVAANGCPVITPTAKVDGSIDHLNVKEGKLMVGLSKRHTEVLLLLSKDMLVREIAEALGISCRTAEGHVRQIYKALGVRSAVGAVLEGVRRGIIVL